MKNYAIILAAGKGRRFGGEKQFYPLKKLPLFLYSVIAFNKFKGCSEIVVVTNENKIGLVKRLVKKYKLNKVKSVVAGGERRIDSTYQGLKILPESGVVAVHDGVRPIIDQNMIKRGYKFAKKYRAVIFGISVEETIKKIKDSRVLKTLPRDDLYRIQTPQFFEIGLLRQALSSTLKEGAEVSDESSLIERLGYPVYFFLGDKKNIKVTTYEDIALVSQFLKG